MSRGKSRSPRATCGCTGRVGSAALAQRKGPMCCTNTRRDGAQSIQRHSYRAFGAICTRAAVRRTPSCRSRSRWWGAGLMRGANSTRRSSPLPRGMLLRRISTRGLTSATGSSPLSRSWQTCPPKNDTSSILNRPGLCWTSYSVYGHHPVEQGAGYTRSLQAMALVSRCKHLPNGSNRFTTHPSPPGAARWNT